MHKISIYTNRILVEVFKHLFLLLPSLLKSSKILTKKIFLRLFFSFLKNAYKINV